MELSLCQGQCKSLALWDKGFGEWLFFLVLSLLLRTEYLLSPVHWPLPSSLHFIPSLCIHKTSILPSHHSPPPPREALPPVRYGSPLP